MTTPDITLNSALDPKALREAFDQEKRLHIPGILNDDAARALHKSLRDELAWNLAYNDEAGQQDLFPSQQQSMTPQDRQAFQQKIQARARSGKFSYLYGSFAVGDAYKENLIRDMFVSRFYEFVNSKPVFEFIQEVTGARRIREASMQATAYGPGHFLTEHNDFDPKLDRKVAYVFNMTPEWKAEWGGILQFLDDDGLQEKGFIPAFNALNIFTVPQRHIVSQVAGYAPKVRYSLTGWFHGNPD